MANSVQDLREGDEASIDVAVTPETVEAFTRLSGDDAPLHTSAEFAQSSGFDGTLVHGALLAAFVSRLVGGVLPGPTSLLQRMNLSFRAPCYAPAHLRLTARVLQVSKAVRSVRVEILIEDEESKLLASGETAHLMLR